MFVYTICLLQQREEKETLIMFIDIHSYIQLHIRYQYKIINNLLFQLICFFIWHVLDFVTKHTFRFFFHVQITEKSQKGS